jgi:hypothetical protein
MIAGGLIKGMAGSDRFSTAGYSEMLEEELEDA